MSKLRSMRITTIPKDSESESFVSQIINYDRNGNEIARYEYRGPGEFESKQEFRFNENNKILEETNYQDEHEILERKIFTRDENGQVEKIDIEYNDGSFSVQTVEKDDEANTENWIERDEDDEQESREFLKYDEKGRVILRESYDFNDKLLEAFEYEYNESGQLSRQRHLDDRRKLILETEFRYTESGQLLLRASRNRKGDLSDFLKIEYNENNKPVRQSFSGKYTFLFEYDDNGNTVVEEQYAGESLLENRITFEYDVNNRVVLEEQLKLSKQYEYEYYD
jgi:DNA-binding MarR family transcriptional regulator